MKKRSLLGIILLLLGIAIAFFIHQGVNCHFRPMDNCKGRTVRLDMDLEDAVTDGNSGSPIMNDKGELIGLAFDGNWEAMSGDVNFEPKLQRTINVDIRYVLFVIDKYAGGIYFFNAECGMRNNYLIPVGLFRISHSAFRIPY